MPGLSPDAAVQSKVDRTRSEFEYVRQYDIAPATTIAEEGTILMRAAGAGGSEVVSPTAGAATDVPLGLALHSSIQATTMVAQIQKTIPASGTLTVDLGRTNIVDAGSSVAEALGVASTTGALTTVAAGVPSSGEMAINLTTGIATFHADEAGQDVTITYRWNLTVLESNQIFRDSHINRALGQGGGPEASFGKVMVGVGRCVVYTTMYDAGATWVQHGTTTAACVLGAGGIFTTNARNGTGVAFGKVIKVPSVADPYLGVEYVTVH